MFYEGRSSLMFTQMNATEKHGKRADAVSDESAHQSIATALCYAFGAVSQLFLHTIDWE